MIKNIICNLITIEQDLVAIKQLDIISSSLIGSLFRLFKGPGSVLIVLSNRLKLFAEVGNDIDPDLFS